MLRFSNFAGWVITRYFQVTLLITTHKFNAQEINTVRSKIGFCINEINEQYGIELTLNA